ncbi:MAG: Ni/Fe hydrogenase subunit alpha [Chloroflexota bacterium]|nr:MAG: Ni/Fe hydrogenase subunit alpha [Chloroflexota bacterium]
MSEKLIKVDDLGRVEGEGGIDIRLVDGQVQRVEFHIFEPPRFFEAFLIGRKFHELPDMTARICGICPVAYQMSSIHACEHAFGTAIDPAIRELRRLFYCGEWIESHVLHMFLLAAPDFFGYPSAIAMAQDRPELRQVVQRALSLKRVGNDIVALLGGREIHPVGAQVGGFSRTPTQEELVRSLRDLLLQAKDDAVWSMQFVSGLELPDLSHDIEFVSLSHPDEYPMNEGRIVSNKGLDIAVEQFGDYFVEGQSPYSNALPVLVKGRGPFFVGPLARMNLNFDRLSAETKQVAATTGIPFPNDNPFVSIVARAIEVHYAVCEALRIIDSYHKPAQSMAIVQPRQASGHGATEAPRGLLYHGYSFDDAGLIRSARIIPPTASNQYMIEEDLRLYAPRVAGAMPHEQAVHHCEMAVRNYDPCISCSTHALRVTLSID